MTSPHKIGFKVPGAVGKRQRTLTSAGAREDIPCTDGGTRLPVALPECVPHLYSCISFSEGICCTAFRLRGEELRAQLSQACAISGIPPPLAPTTPDFTLHPVTRAMTSSR